MTVKQAQATSANMEGVIWKWTNYWAGWQPRWFVLEGGVLSYYKSKDEITKSCKGYIKMSMCEIAVHPTDTNRLDLIIPSEQHFYLRVATPQQRQQWLVALGSAKASLGTHRKKKKKQSQSASSASASSSQPSSSSASASLSPQPPDDVASSGSLQRSSNSVPLSNGSSIEKPRAAKTSELRVYCDLLMQQVHSVKTIATTTATATADIAALDDATRQLAATCDTFIKALEQCMIAAEVVGVKSLSSSSSSADHYGRLLSASDEEDDSNKNSKHTMVECDDDGSIQSPASAVVDGATTDTEDPSEEFEDAQESHESPNQPETETQVLVSTENGVVEPIEHGEDVPPRMKTFFSNLQVSFLNMKLTKDGGIPTKHFLESCAIVITIFEMFGSPIFVPMKIDVNGNLRKITAKFNSNPKRFQTLQDIIQHEMDTDTTLVRNSATDAIMWLKRGLEFVYEFLLEFHRNNLDLKQCALDAYNRTLKQYHGWIVRNIITTGTKAVPGRKEVLVKLAVNPADVDDPDYELELTRDARRFTRAMRHIIRILNDFYDRHNLDTKEVTS